MAVVGRLDAFQPDAFDDAGAFQGPADPAFQQDAFWGDAFQAVRMVSALGTLSAEASGTPKLTLLVKPVGTLTAEAGGTDRVMVRLLAAGTATAEASGTPKLTALVRPLGVTTAEASGASRLTTRLFEQGTATSETSGTPRITSILRPIGILTGEQAGVPRLTTRLQPVGNPSTESAGTPIVRPYEPLRFLALDGTFTAEDAGDPLLVQGPAPPPRAPVLNGPRFIYTSRPFATTPDQVIEPVRAPARMAAHFSGTETAEAHGQITLIPLPGEPRFTDQDFAALLALELV